MCGTTSARCLWAIVVASLSLFPASCGDDDDDAAGGPSTLSIVEREDGNELKLEVEGDPAPGLTRITFRNEGKKRHSAQLIQVTGNRSKDAMIAAYKRAANNRALPSWFFGAGGVGSTAPGKTASVTQDMREGTYFVVDDEDDANSTKGGLAKFNVSGDFRAGSLPRGPRIVAEEYTFTATRIKAGNPTVVFANAGRQPHHLVAAPILPGKTVEDVNEFLKQDNPKGRPPADFDAGVSTAVLEGGRSLATKLRLKKGKYALLCFTADRKGGPPHVSKGMVSEAVVE